MDIVWRKIGFKREFSRFRIDRAERLTVGNDFGYSFPFFLFRRKKDEEEKENKLAKIVNKGHAFLLDLSDVQI